MLPVADPSASWPDADAPLIEIRDLTKSFGDKTVLAGVNWQVPRGQICGLLGPNGAGKTTLFRLLMGILKANAGSLQIEGLDAQGDLVFSGPIDTEARRAQAQKEVQNFSQKLDTATDEEKALAVESRKQAEKLLDETEPEKALTEEEVKLGSDLRHDFARDDQRNSELRKAFWRDLRPRRRNLRRGHARLVCDRL